MPNKFEWILLLKSFPIKHAKAMYKMLKNAYAKDASLYGNKRWEIFRYHKKVNPHYNKLAGHVSSDLWDDVPVITKSNFQYPLSTVVTPEFLNRNYTSKTSGSSGTPLFFAKDKLCHALTWAEILAHYSEHGIRYGKSLQARFYAIPLEGVSYYIERLKDFITSRYRFVIHNMADTQLEKFVRIFKRKRFEYIYGYTNSLVLFARYLIRQEIILRNICPSIRICVVTSEVCSPEDRIILETAFGVPVINEYGASEIGLIAFEDKHLNWRVSTELLYVEILDDNNKSVPDGVVGKIVVTNYFNKAMPFIRYEVGDRGSLWRDSQGNVYLEKLYGRLNDVLILPDGKIVPGFTLYYATKAMMERLPGMREYNIRQTALEQITFDLVSDQKISEDQRIEIERIVKQYLSEKFTVVFRQVNKIDRLPSGKMKHFHALRQD